MHVVMRTAPLNRFVERKSSIAGDGIETTYWLRRTERTRQVEIHLH